jgi:hypothetical protein
MKLIIFMILIIVFLLTLFPFFRCLFSNFFKLFYYVPIDLYDFIRKYKNIPKKPFINCYVGLFGTGKTLSAVHDVIDFYNSFNNVRVYDDRIHDYVTQKVFVLSNVDLKTIPYRNFHSLEQIVNISRWRHHTDKKKKQRTITIVLGDEFSIQMNSRNFKSNIPVQFLNALLSSRHSLVHGFYLTSQRFNHMDALLRQICSNVIECKKIWRVELNYYFDAWDYENASKKNEVLCRKKESWFIRNQDFNSYDTLQVVSQLSKDISEGCVYSDQEILERQGQKLKVCVDQKNYKKRK